VQINSQGRFVFLLRLEKTEGSMKNGQSRDTGNFGHKTQTEDKTKTNQKKYKRNISSTQKTMIISKAKSKTKITKTKTKTKQNKKDTEPLTTTANIGSR
jgi:hypothetical protein